MVYYYFPAIGELLEIEIKRKNPGRPIVFTLKLKLPDSKRGIRTQNVNFQI